MFWLILLRFDGGGVQCGVLVGVECVCLCVIMHDSCIVCTLFMGVCVIVFWHFFVYLLVRLCLLVGFFRWDCWYLSMCVCVCVSAYLSVCTGMLFFLGRGEQKSDGESMFWNPWQPHWWNLNSPSIKMLISLQETAPLVRAHNQHVSNSGSRGYVSTFGIVYMKHRVWCLSERSEFMSEFVIPK